MFKKFIIITRECYTPLIQGIMLWRIFTVDYLVYVVKSNSMPFYLTTLDTTGDFTCDINYQQLKLRKQFNAKSKLPYILIQELVNLIN